MEWVMVMVLVMICRDSASGATDGVKLQLLYININWILHSGTGSKWQATWMAL